MRFIIITQSYQVLGYDYFLYNFREDWQENKHGSV